MSVDSFYSKLAEINPRACILSIVSDHLDNFIPQSCSRNFPVSIPSLYDSKYLDMSYDQLLLECDCVFNSLNVTAEQALLVEQHTRE